VRKALPIRDGTSDAADLAWAYESLAVLLSRDGSLSAEASTAAEEAIRYYRPRAQAGLLDADQLAGFGFALEATQTQLMAAHLHSQALVVAQERVTVARLLAAAAPDRASTLRYTLHDLADLLVHNRQYRWAAAIRNQANSITVPE
jgi:hypothetical protein